MTTSAPQRTKRGLATWLTDVQPPWSPRGTPLVLMHGIGTDHHVFDGWLPTLLPHMPVIRFDTRGFGQSVIPGKDHRWSLNELVADLLEVADLAGGRPVTVAGESLGGTVALAAALAHPRRIAAVAISNATHKGPGVGRIAGWREEFARDGVAGWSRRMMEHRFAPGQGTPEALAWFAGQQARSEPHVVCALGDLLAGLDLSGALGGLRQPLLIMGPDGSPFITPDHFADLKRLVPHAELKVVPGTRHGLPLTHGPELATALLSFLARNEGSRQ